jgi:hypothetical protein
MGTYKEIRGTHIVSVTSDPPSPVNGQMWYNSTDKVVKGFTSSPAGTWSTAANMNTARHSGIASAGANAEAALGFGGGPPPAPGAVAITESWNGSAWTEVADLNTARALAGGAGNYTSAIAAGGDQYSGTAESWNGTSWANITSSPNTGHTQQGAGADNEDALIFGGSPYASNNNSDYWNGSAWTELANLNTARQAGAGSGKTYTAALAIGGENPSGILSINESYNGSSWTELADLNTGRAYAGADGTQTSSLFFGGNTGPPNKSETESWNGSSWTETGDLNTARSYLGRGGANNTSALAFSGAPSAATEEFVTPTTSTVTFTVS